MIEKRSFSISFYEGEEAPGITLQYEHSSVEDAIKHVQGFGVPLEVVVITEWEGEEIICSGVNLQCVFDDNVADLSKYIR